MAEMPEKKDVVNTRDPKEVPLPPDIDVLRAGFPQLQEARKLFSGTGPTAREYLDGKKLTPKTVVDERHVDTLKELKLKFEGKDNRTLEALAVINQTNAQLVRLQQVNDKTRAIPTDEERAVLSNEVIFTVLPGLMDRNLKMLDRYLVLKKQHAAYGVAADPALEKTVQDQLQKFNAASTARLALWGSRDVAALQKATDALQEAINPLPVMVNALYGDIIDRALRKNNELILSKATEYEVALKLKLKEGTVTDADKKALYEKYRAEIDELQKIGSSLGVELESLLRHNGLENIADVEELSIPEGQRDYQTPAKVNPAEKIDPKRAEDAAVEGEKIVNSSIDGLTENFREHFDMVLGPRNGRPAKDYEKDYLLNTKRWDIRAEDVWTKHASMRVAQVLTLLSKYRGGVRSMVVNGPRKVATGITRATVGDKAADALDYSMKKVLSTKEGGEYAKDQMAEIVKSFGLPEGFDLTSQKDWKDLEEDKRWPGAKARHEQKMMTVKDNIEKFRAEIEVPARAFESDLDLLDALRKKTNPRLLVGKRADQAMVLEFQKKGLTMDDIAKLDPNDAKTLLAAYVALYLQMRGHWDAYCRAMGKLEVGIMGNIQRHQDTAVAARVAGANQQAEDDDFLKWLIFAAAGIATSYVLGGRGGAARPFGNRIAMNRPIGRILNGPLSLVDRTFYAGPKRAIERGSLGGYVSGFLKPGQTPAEALTDTKTELAKLKAEASADKGKIAELEAKVAELELAIEEAKIEADTRGRTAETEIDPSKIDLAKLDPKAVIDLAIKLDIKVDGRTDTDVKTDVEAALKAGTHPKIKRK